jgi:hypothetical protein
MSESKQSFVRKNVFLTIGKMLLRNVTKLAYFRTYFQLYYACNQHSISHAWVFLGSTGRSTGVRRRQEDMVESVTWNKETLIGH